jgi:hypothetical protein
MATVEKTIAKRAKAHTTYKTAEGRRAPGVTTVLGIINKPALIPWANQLGLQGINSAAYVDETARIGTLAHEMIQEYLGGPRWDRAAFSPEQINLAENAVLSYYEWERVNGFNTRTLHIELPLVSEVFLYGGTIDWYGEINGEKWLVDLKTSKGLYPEHIYQVSAYHQLLVENGYEVDGVRLLRVGRTEDEGFDDHVLNAPTLDAGWRVFEAALELYRAAGDFKKLNREVA